ncbi:hypothetical protein AMECASPLE_031878 [Ameca splendens]|uniref:Uncharacterized protein n=1 Tax=Ameca splendens TaxID=208324 RepID=A0ABV1A1V3_9TELE
MLHCPTHPTANRSPAPSQGQEPQKKALEEGHHSTPQQDRAPRQPHTQIPEVPQDAGRPPTLSYGTPRRSKQAGQPLHQSEATSQSTLDTARPRPPRRNLALPKRRTGLQSQGPRSKVIQTILRGLKSQPQHQTTPKTQTPTPVQNP